MPKTISFHNGTVWSRGHNVRDERYTKKQEHIDPTLSSQNVVLRDTPVRQAYKDIFGWAVEEYNSRQKRTDRHINDYYEKIKTDKRKHPVYECIVQIGDRNDTGNSAELEKQALIKFVEEWDERNPNLRLIGAYVHCDEPDGTVHMHLDYIPLAECSKGMLIQNSLDRALQQQGFKSENIHQTAQIAWQEREREALTAICREFSIDAQHSQGIGKRRKYLTPQEYRIAKDEQQAQIDDELQPLKEKLDEYIQLDVSAKAFVVDEKKLPFIKRVSVATDDMKRLKEQAKAYGINQLEIKTLREKKDTLDKRQSELDERSESLDKREQQLQKDRQTVRNDYQAVKEMYNKQCNINELLGSSETYVSVLTDKNLSLSRTVDNHAKTIQELQEQVKKLQETLRGAYESLTNVTQAIGMLKYSERDYKASLTEQQSRLIEAIAKYSERWANLDGYPDLAEDIRTHISISDGIQDEIKELMPKRRSRGMSL
ncbi:MAG: plasmid recombination protein [Alistipes senegalensis]|nr:plasmid recombination protein [Alistipes senegalensis]